MIKRIGSRKAVPELTEKEREEMTEISVRAREMLKPFALIDHHLPSIQFKDEFMSCGGHEGCCTLLAAAHFDMSTLEGSLKDDEQDVAERKKRQINTDYSHATLETYRLIDNMLNFVSTALVVKGLTLTVAATWLTVGLSAFSSFEPSLRGNGDDKAESFFQSWASNRDLLFVFHCLECIFVTLTAVVSTSGLYYGFYLTGTVGIYCVSLESKLRYLIERIHAVAYVWGYTFGSLFFLSLAMPCIAARHSPVLCLCSLAVPSAMMRAFYTSMMDAEFVCKEQHRQARAILGIPLHQKFDRD